MQRSSRDPSVDFNDHSTARGSTPGPDYSRRYGHYNQYNNNFGTMSNDSSSVSGGVMSRSASQLTAMQNGMMSPGSDAEGNKNKNQQQQHLEDEDEDLADEVPARHLSIIEVARQMLLPVFYERLLDRQGLIQTCGTVLDQFLDMESQGLRQMGAAEGATVDANTPLSERDIQQVQRLVDGQLRELQKRRPQMGSSGRGSAMAAGDADDDLMSAADVRGSASLSRQQSNKRRRGGGGADADDEDDGESLELGTASAGHGGRVSGGGGVGRGGADDETALSGTTGFGGSQQQFPSIFRSVMYSAKGPLPNPPPPPLPNHKLAASDAFLRVSLDKPHLTTSNSDVVITGVVHTRALVDLRWWIGYGPMKLVIDLEKLRNIGAVGTFQVSHSAFILSIGAGTLIPGAEYTVHLQAAAVDFAGIGKDARVEFTMPVADDESQDILWRRLQRMTSSGYGADTEKGVLSLRPDPQKMKELDQEYWAAKEQAKQQAEQRDRQNKEKEVERQRRFKILAASKAGKIDPATASKMLMLGQQLPVAIENAMKEEEENKKQAALDAAAAADGDHHQQGDVPNMEGTNLPDAAVVMASGTRNKLTYHEQLKNFVLNEVEPVYTLCASPRFTHEVFTQLLRSVVKQFWYARPAGSGILDGELKKKILAELRKEISNYVQQSAGKQLVVGGQGASAGAGSPEAGRLLQASLEKVGPEAEVGTTSLLSPEQRERLAAVGAGGRRGSRRGSFKAPTAAGVATATTGQSP